MTSPADSYLWEYLKKAKGEIASRLRERDPALLFQSVFVDYEPPFVERLWFQMDPDHRVFLHHILPCAPGAALWHPHPWPSIVEVCASDGPEAEYEHGVGYEGADGNPPVAVVQRIRGKITYVMDSPKAWHYVRPTGDSWSIMIVGKPFPTEELSRGYVRPTKVLRPLSPERKTALLNRWMGILNVWWEDPHL